jgi:DNA replication protein DnaC
MLKDELTECCKKLKLSQKLAENAIRIENGNNQEYLLELLKSEIENREISRINRLIKEAGFYSLKTLESFKYDEVQLPGEINEEYLKELKFIEDKTNIVMYGNVGTGKTHLSTALGLEACKKGICTGFFRTAALVNRLSEAKASGTLSGLMKKIMKAEVLILDEWGYVPLDRIGAQLLFEVVSECYERKTLIINTNIEFSRWINVFYDEQMTGAIIDRLLHHCHLLLFPGQSNRMKRINEI